MHAGQPGFWDVEERLRELTARGDPLEKLGVTVDFEIFRADLEAALGPRDPSKGGRPPFDPVLKFRMLVLQAMHGPSLKRPRSRCRTGSAGCAFAGSAPAMRCRTPTRRGTSGRR